MEIKSVQNMPVTNLTSTFFPAKRVEPSLN